MQTPVRSLNVAFLVLLSLLFVACSKKDEQGKVRIVLPSQVSVSKASASQQSLSTSSEESSWNSLLNPTTGSEINCFAIFVGGGELNANSCDSAVTGEKLATFGPYVGFAPAGSAIEVTTPPGDRRIYVVGLRAQNNACKNMVGAEPDKNNLSEPFLIASQQAQIPSGASTLAIAAQLDLTKRISDCSMNAGGNANAAARFGDKRDGTIVSGSPNQIVYADGSTVLSQTGIHTPMTGGQPAAKVVSTTARVIGVSGAAIDANKIISLASPTTVSQFDVGDEVVWYVAAGASTAGSPDEPVAGACGGSLYRGAWGVARIETRISGTQFKLSTAISDPTKAPVKNANLANVSIASTANSFCRVILARVPNFERIEVQPGHNFALHAAQLDLANGTGGIIAMRVKEIKVGAGGSFSARSDAAGLGGGMAGSQGTGTEGSGLGNVTNNGSGGGAGMGGRHSGAGAGAAGNGGHATAGTSSGTGGMASRYCGTSGGVPCRALSDRKAMLGGGGGSNSAQPGLPGGGLTLVFAQRITGLGKVDISSNGGEIARTIEPTITGTVAAIAPDGAGGAYIGGTFTQVDGVSRGNLIRMRNDGKLDPTFNPNIAGGSVLSLLFDGSRLHVGGSFLTAGGSAAVRYAVLNPNTGALIANGNADAEVKTMVLYGGTLYVGGNFQNILSVARNRLAAINTTSNTPLAWNPGGSGADAYILTMGTDGSALYVGGQFANIGGNAIPYIAKLDLSTGSVDTGWTPNPNNTVNALVVNSGYLYVGGAFTSIGGAGPAYLAKINGTGSGSYVAWSASPNAPVTALALTASSIYIGGNFTTAGGASRYHFAEIDRSTANATALNATETASFATAATFAVDGGVLHVGGSMAAFNDVKGTQYTRFDMVSGQPVASNSNYASPGGGGSVGFVNRSIIGTTVKLSAQGGRGKYTSGSAGSGSIDSVRCQAGTTSAGSVTLSATSVPGTNAAAGGGAGVEQDQNDAALCLLSE